jgi:hypothetical protein
MRNRRTVLFVDDEVRLLRALERGLVREPYDKLFAESRCSRSWKSMKCTSL